MKKRFESNNNTIAILIIQQQKIKLLILGMKRSYVFKHWGCTLVLFAIFLPIYEIFTESENLNDIFNGIWFFPVILIVSIVYSIPTLLIDLLTFDILLSYQVNLKWVKAILITVTIVCIFLTFSLTSYASINRVDWNAPSICAAAAILSGLLLKIRET